MSGHTVLQMGVRKALQILATPGLTYRKGRTGVWLSFLATDYAVLHVDFPQVLGADDQHNAISAPMTAHLKVVDTGTVLDVGVSSDAWQIKTADNTVWAVTGVSRKTGQTIYQLFRSIDKLRGEPRGATQ